MSIKYQHLHEAIYSRLKENPNALCLSLPSNQKRPEKVIHKDFTGANVLEATAFYMALLRSKKVNAGDKVIVLAPLSLDTIAQMLAVMALGGVVVLIDISMKFSHVLAAIKNSEAKAILTTKLFKVILALLPASFGIKKLVLPSAAKAIIGSGRFNFQNWDLVNRKDCDPALITFTSGTTSQPKAVNRTHGILAHQRLAIANNHPSHQGALVHCFPVLILYHLSVGTHSVLAHRSTKPMTSLPKVTLEQIKRYKADALIAAPTFLENLTRWTVKNQQEDILSKLRFIGCGGAPIPFKLLARINQLCPTTCAWVVFGSTEAEPIAHCSFGFALNQGLERGLPVGKIVSELKYRIVDLPHQKSYTEKDIEAAICKDSKVGELIISGQHVVEEYLHNDLANEKSKIRTQEGELWHRCGDLAYQDQEGHVFILGRKGDEIRLADKAVFPFQLEYQLDSIENIKRSALLQKNGQTLLFIELEAADNCFDQNKVTSLLQRFGLTNTTIKTISAMPLDKRHNSKINRPALRSLKIK